MSFRKQVLLLALVLAHAQEASAGLCRVRLSAVIEATIPSPHKKKAKLLDTEKLVEESKAAREEASADPDLKVKTSSSGARKPEETEAWLTHFSNRIKAVRDGAEQKMSLEEFFGMIHSSQSRAMSNFEDIFEKFKIKHIRLVGNKKFKAELSKKAEGEIVLSVPDFPIDNPQAAAIWLKDLYLNLHKAARLSLTKEISTLKFADARIKAEARLKSLDKEVLGVLKELDAYLKYKDPSEENPLNLPNRSLPPKPWYHFSSAYVTTDTALAGGTGALAGKHLLGPWLGDIGPLLGQVDVIWISKLLEPSFGGAELGAAIGGGAGIVLGLVTKLKAPLELWTPSTGVWLKSHQALEIERSRLWNDYMKSHYRYKLLDKVVKFTLKSLVLGTTGAMGLYYVHNRGLVGDAEEGLEEESGNVEKIDQMAEAQLASLNGDQLNEKYNELMKSRDKLEALLLEAESKNDIKKAEHINSELAGVKLYGMKILYKIEALNPDGPAVERANESVPDEN